MRSDLHVLVRMLAAVPGIRDIALTTNGILLAEQAAALKAAGLHRLNISLDALSEETFERIARRKGLQRVLDGISAAQKAGFRKIRLNAVSIRGITEDEIVPLARFRATIIWNCASSNTCRSMRNIIGSTTRCSAAPKCAKSFDQEVGALEPLPVEDPSQPATDFRYTDGGGRVGFINPVTEPFCGNCNRLRLTAEGQVRNCLFSTVEWDARALLRGGGSDEDIAALVEACVGAKKAGHGIDTPDFIRPDARHVSNRRLTERTVLCPRFCPLLCMRRIYLDNAATSWPKPTAVYDAVDKYLRENGAPAGRGTYSQAAEVERTIASGRAAIARLIGAADARQIIFTSNGTEALNLAIHGLLRPGDHAICTWADHNSVLRPLRQLEEHGQVEVTRVQCDATGLVIPTTSAAPCGPTRDWSPYCTLRMSPA